MNQNNPKQHLNQSQQEEPDLSIPELESIQVPHDFDFDFTANFDELVGKTRKHGRKNDVKIRPKKKKRTAVK